MMLVPSAEVHSPLLTMIFSTNLLLFTERITSPELTRPQAVEIMITSQSSRTRDHMFGFVILPRTCRYVRQKIFAIGQIRICEKINNKKLATSNV